ncbi:hypothetical protein E2C01_075063 [Portunus trituberculatus]|uniref:Uncharacterized protein n=1 Tax=Portunus trituberculatus TaxID=210409 RepID=A0A5B7IDZ2_PORTR|nr:hypothetical protein [Portunus trituberculatus]
MGKLQNTKTILQPVSVSAAPGQTPHTKVRTTTTTTTTNTTNTTTTTTTSAEPNFTHPTQTACGLCVPTRRPN